MAPISWIYVTLSAIVPIVMYGVVFALRIRRDPQCARWAAILMALTLAPGAVVLAGASRAADESAAPNPALDWINVQLWQYVGTGAYVLGVMLMYVLWSVHVARRDAQAREADGK